jgi:hypothetical protein
MNFPNTICCGCPPNNRLAEVIEMGVLLAIAAVVFAVSAWVYAWLTPNTPKVERLAEFIFLVTCLGLAAIATIVALAHI